MIHNQKVQMHPDYKKGSKYNDIAIITFSREVNMSSRVFPACLISKVPDKMTIAGFGLTESKLSRFKRKNS